MSADTLTADGGAATIASPPPDENGHTYYAVGYAAVPGQDEIVTLWLSNSVSPSSYSGGPAGAELLATGDSLNGSRLFSYTAMDTNNYPAGIDGVTATALSNGDVALAWNVPVGDQAGSASNAYAVLSPDGAVDNHGYMPQAFAPNGQPYNYAGPPDLYATYRGFTIEANLEARSAGAPPSGDGYQINTFDMTGALIASSTRPEAGFTAFVAHATASDASGRGADLTDNIINYYEPNGAEQRAVTIPGEPAHAITSEAVAMLTSGDAAVAWADSGTDYVALYHASTMSFSPAIGLDWGGASDLHVVALPDGGFAVSWMNGGAYKGELFDSAGAGGGVIPVAGDVAGVDSHGDLYTVGLDSSGNEVVQTYAINSSGGGSSTGSGATVYTSAPSYTAPDGVSTIYLTGSNQSIHANNAGDTIFSDNTVNHLYGGTGNDTFHLGRGGDFATGGGGNDVFAYAEMPWAGGQITDFGGTDVLDLSGLIATTGETGSNALADGYLQVVSDGAGGSDIMARYATSGDNSAWWLVTDLDHVNPNSLQFSNGAFTVSSSAPTPSSSVSTSDANYTAPPGVDFITLTGSHQTATANNADNTTIWSNDTGNTIHGGTGDDVIHIGRGGDTVSGGYGHDVFVFGDIPWAAATITDFSAADGDSIDVSGILSKAGYTGSDPIADGYLGEDVSGPFLKIWANYHQPGNDGWWLVATVKQPGAMSYHDGVFSDGPTTGTFTTSGNGVVPDGYDAGIVTGTGGSITANTGGDELVDQGSGNILYGRGGNDTFLFGTDTRSAFGEGGVDIFVLAAHATTAPFIGDALATQDKINVNPVLQAAGYSGADPTADGTLTVVNGDAWGPSQPGVVHAKLMFDPDGSSGPASATDILDFAYNPSIHSLHYQGGFFVVS